MTLTPKRGCSFDVGIRNDLKATQSSQQLRPNRPKAPAEVLFRYQFSQPTQEEKLATMQTPEQGPQSVASG